MRLNQTAPHEAFTGSSLLYPSALTDEQRLRLVQVVVAFVLLVGFLLSPRLWMTGRDFPLLPRFSFVPPLPVPLDLMAFAGLTILLVAILVGRSSRVATITFGVLLTFLVAEDQTRCQPWVYQYALMLMVLLPRPHDANPGSSESRLAVLRLMLAAIYFWSGLQKLNVTFLNDTGPWLVEPVFRLLPGWTAALGPSVYALPAAEVFIAVGLLLPVVTRVAISLALLMHVFILFVLGPLGHNQNSIVWPWNLAMMAFVWLLFGGTDGVSRRRIWSPTSPSFRQLTAVALCVVCPSLNFIGLWPHNLSWPLYAGTSVQATLYIDDAALPCLPETVRKYVVKAGGGNALDMWDWALSALNVPPYPERWTYDRIRRQLCVCDGGRQLIVLDLWDPPRWRPTEVEEFDCSS